MIKNIILIMVSIILLLNFVYHKLISTYLVKNNELSYDIYMDYFLKNVIKDSHYMNYGLWDENTTDLRKANENLVNFIFERMNKTPDMKILDVGCGYGEQDIAWINKLADQKATINAIDISEKQIKTAREIRDANNIKSDQLNFEIGNALDIDEKYKNSDPFDIVVSLESAFHYKDRPKFFKNVHQVLKQDTGTFIITDIMLQNNYNKSFLNNLFIKIFSDTFHVPKRNLIEADKWKQNIIDAGFEITECNDVTDQTFKPLYNNFIENFCKKIHLPKIISSVGDKFLQKYQPLAYMIATCKIK